MPLYDYRCPANGRTVEVRHSMRESISSWGELCRQAGIDPGDTAPGTPVQRVVTVPALLAKAGQVSAGGSCCGIAGCAPDH